MALTTTRGATTAQAISGELNSNLALNFFRASFSSESASVCSGHYAGPAALEELRTTHPQLTFWRDRDDGSRLYAWSVDGDAGYPAGFQPVTVSFEESPPLFQRLLQDGIDARMQRLGFQEKSGGWVNYSRPSIMAQVPALAPAAGDAIGIYPKLMVEVFFTRSSDGVLLIGLVVDVLYTTRLDVPAAEWVAAGLSDQLIGAYVTLIRAPNAGLQHLVDKSIGRIDGLRGNKCVLKDLRDPALAEVSLADVAPEPSRTNLALYLGARYEQAYATGQHALTRKLRELVRPRSRYDLARALVLKRLQNPSDGVSSLRVLPGLTASIQDAVSVATAFAAYRLRDSSSYAMPW